MFGRIKKIHFIGLGGIGISGMAELLHGLGYNISGSDLVATDITANLEKLGIKFYAGHAASQVDECDMVVYSAAVRDSNPELQAARNRHIPVIRRAEMLGELLRVANTSVAVGGTHGKTTTSSMIGTMLTSAKLDPTMIIGGIVKSLASNSRRGEGDIIVVEADEFDRTFLYLQPTIAVITNIDLEHLDCYKNLDDLTDAFTQFANAVPFYGKIIVCLDDTNVQAIMPDLWRPVTTYGLAQQADVRAVKPVFHENHTTFTLIHNGDEAVEVTLNTPGKHNVLNALAAIATGLELQVDLTDIIAGLSQFTGVGRRFEILAQENDVMFIDDYAHHPSEVAAVLDAARTGWDRRIVAVFQPHLYTRTRDFHEDFARSFLGSDVVIITDVYPAREDPIEGVSGDLVANSTQEIGHKQVYYIPDLAQLAQATAELIRPGDMVLTLGAGSITNYNAEIQAAYRERLTK